MKEAQHQRELNRLVVETQAEQLRAYHERIRKEREVTCRLALISARTRCGTQLIRLFVSRRKPK